MGVSRTTRLRSFLEFSSLLISAHLPILHIVQGRLLLFVEMSMHDVCMLEEVFEGWLRGAQAYDDQPATFPGKLRGH